MNLLKKLDDDTAKLVSKSNEREEELIKIDINSIEMNKPKGEEVKLFSEYTNAACGALKPPSTNFEKQRSEVYSNELSKSLTIVFILIAVASLLLAVIVSRTKQSSNKTGT